MINLLNIAENKGLKKNEGAGTSVPVLCWAEMDFHAQRHEPALDFFYY